MYDWRKMTEAERREVFKQRRRQLRPHHAPPRAIITPGTFSITAACYEHKPLISSPDRRSGFARDLLDHLRPITTIIHAWVVMPNHYHVLVDLSVSINLRSYMGKLHGRTSREWNLEEDATGRKVWFHCIEKGITANRHFYRTLNYIHHNPVKAGLCQTWTDWDASSAGEYLIRVGRKEALRIWKEYPVNE